MAKEKVKEELGWYDKFKLALNEIGVQSVNPVLELIDKTKDNETQEKVDEINSLIQHLELTPEEAVLVFRRFNEDSKSFNSSSDSLKFVQGKLNRQVRLLANRINRAIPQGFGSYIRHLRERKGYSLKEVENITGISPSYINRIEKGERKAPSYPIIEKLSEAYRVDISELLKIAGISTEEVNVQSFPQIVYSNNFTINGKIVSNKQKELLIELITKMDEVAWNDTSKHIDSINLIQLIDAYKAIKN